MTGCDHRWADRGDGISCARCHGALRDVLPIDLQREAELVRLSERVREAEEARKAAEARGAARQREADIVWIRDEWNSYDSDDASAAWRIASDLAVEPLVTRDPEKENRP